MVRDHAAPANHSNLVGGSRCCSPGEVGGVYGYSEYVEAILDSSHELHEEVIEWRGDSFDPEEFDEEFIRERPERIRISG